MDDATELVTVRVAELYYDEGKSQDEVGALLGLTRWKVGRLLARARETGIVRIEIVHPRARKHGLERRLCAAFGLRDAVVVPAPADSADLDARVAQSAADFLAAMRPVPRLLGVSWGRTMQAVADLLPEGWGVGVDVVLINGGVTVNQRPGTAAATAVAIAHKAGGRATHLPSPAILERIETKLAIESDRTVAAVLELAAAADAYVFTAGAADSGSVHVASGYISPDELAELVRKGAVGDVVGRYIDADGNVVDPGLDERTVGLGLDHLRSAARSILVVGGERKHPVARAAVGSGLCSTLITDENTALHLLEGIPE